MCRGYRRVGVWGEEEGTSPSVRSRGVCVGVNSYLA